MRRLTNQIKELLRMAEERGLQVCVDNCARCNRDASISRVTKAKTLNGVAHIFCLPEKDWRVVYCIDHVYLSEG